MAEIDKYEDSSVQATVDVESSEENTDSGDEESSRDSRDTGDEDDDPLSLLTCAREISVKYLKNKINLKKQSEVYKERGNASYALYSFPWKFLVVHQYLIPTVRETKQNYMPTLKPYTNEVKDTIIDALKANLEGVTVLTSAVENEEDEILAVNEDYTTPTIDKDGVAVDVDEILPLAIVYEDLVTVDEYFAEEVNEQDE
uniref:Uncharacterized protein n=1 Tax=Solanum tuberosum TaxID=4113 RepID=M0ZWW7_SOLTU